MSGSRASRKGVFARVGLVAKVIAPAALRLTVSLEKALKRRGVAVTCDVETAAALGRSGGAPRERIAGEVDLVIVLGGDGTLLSVARDAPGRARILGVNVGALGFLSGVSQREALGRLDEVLAGKFREERRRRLKVLLPEGEAPAALCALNDAVLSKDSIRISTFSISIEGRRISQFRGDGVIVSTPTGSTAYNLSAGGPILHPALRAMVITPICAHTLSQRPLVVPAGLTIDLEVLDGGPRGVQLTLDGQSGFSIRSGAGVRIRESAAPVTLLRPPESDHFHNLAEKLKWGA